MHKVRFLLAVVFHARLTMEMLFERRVMIDSKELLQRRYSNTSMPY
jgi:hypothetical protein